MNRIAAPLALAAALAAAAPALAQDYLRDYANAWNQQQSVRQGFRDGRAGFTYERWQAWGTAGLATTAPSSGAKTWDANNENPWANAYGKPQSNPAWNVTTLKPRSGPARLCACYLPTDARSWSGGPLTEADIARMCRAQCY